MTTHPNLKHFISIAYLMMKQYEVVELQIQSEPNSKTTSCLNPGLFLGRMKLFKIKNNVSNRIIPLCLTKTPHTLLTLV